ncbi:D-xylose 1-dehydrogenase [Aureococcus anophagefferens]|nr:D-xylose 1-dehydrogenase [Aureococcus anophagefferens]
MTAAPFRWAITSAGKIAADFAEAVRRLDGHAVVAVAARSRADAEAFAARHCDRGVQCYGGYEAMFEGARDHGADATYVATQPDTHAELVRALLARKMPTLCEKPLAATFAEVEACYDYAAAQDTFLMEGGEFGYDIAKGCPASVRGHRATGGMSRDIAVYLAEKALLAFDSKDFSCVDARATAVLGAGDGVDLSVAAALRFAPRRAGVGRGGVASLLYTGQCDTPETAVVLGTSGSLRFDAAHHTPTSLVLSTRASRTESADDAMTFPLPADDGCHAWNYPGSIALQYEALAVQRALASGLAEAPEGPPPPF